MGTVVYCATGVFIGSLGICVYFFLVTSKYSGREMLDIYGLLIYLFMIEQVTNLKTVYYTGHVSVYDALRNIISFNKY